MAKQYTAYQMRVASKSCEEMGHSMVAEMLHQAADEMEREKKCQYQYAARYFYPGGIIATDHIFDNQTDARLFSSSREGARKVICRREVGEWEEVSNDND